MAIMAMTTSSSINVKERSAVNLLLLLGKSGNSTWWKRGCISANPITRVNGQEGALSNSHFGAEDGSNGSALN
jgi:hypothetical protein